MTPAIPKSARRASSVERFGPGPLAWLLLSMAIACAGIAAYAIYSPAFALRIAGTRPGSALILIIGLGAMSLLFAALAVPLLLSEIRIDADFLTWRTWRGVSRVPWCDVSDCYETTRQGRIQFHVIKTPHGDCRFSSENSKSDLLRARVVERATNARAKQWEPFGARAYVDDWPITFAYDDALSRWGIAVIRSACYFYLGVIVVFLGPGIWRSACEVASVMGLAWGILLLVVAACVFLWHIVLCLVLFPGFAELRRRRAQTITLSSDGILYHGEIRTVEARWNAITHLSFDLLRARVETENGTFDFRATIKDYRVLKRAIERMASESVPGGWKSTMLSRV